MEPTGNGVQPVTGRSCSGAAANKRQAMAAAGATLLPSLALTICREGAISVVRVRLGREDGLGTDCVVHFCGALVQASAPDCHGG